MKFIVRNLKNWDLPHTKQMYKVTKRYVLNSGITMQKIQNQRVEKLDLPVVNSAHRRYDVDWLRTLAMGLLIIYHVVLTFQPWAAYIGFPQNDQTLEWVWIFMAMINIWRIPILFLVSGMGVCFAMERRDWKQLLLDRTVRILVPYLFGMLVLEYLVGILLPYFGWDANFMITFGHLWFLLNIFLYVLWLIGIIIYFKDNPNNAFLRFLSKVIRMPLGIFLFAIPVMLETWLVSAEYFSLYVTTAHGWILGLICFFYGFVFISLRDVFWPAVQKNRWYALILAFSLYLVRLLVFELKPEANWLTGFESMCWMLAILGFGSLYLNKSSRGLSYLSQAVYPVYIVHMPIQFIIAYFLLPLGLSAYWKLLILTVGTFGISLFLYEYILRRIKWIRPLFGMKLA